MQKSKLMLALGCLGSILACGDLGDADERPPLAVIEGQLSVASTNADLTQNANVRVAVLWGTSTTGYKNSVDAPVSPVFPSKFRLEITDPPPADSMVGPAPEPAPTQDNTSGLSQRIVPANAPGSGGYKVAAGTIVAYEDLNGNGRLDLIGPDTAPVDRVLGTNDELAVVYFEGDPPPLDEYGRPSNATRGYNLRRTPRCAPPTRSAGGSGQTTPCELPTWLPITTPYELLISADPELAGMMCDSTTGTMDAYPDTSNVKPGETPPPGPGPSGWPAADDPNLRCMPDGKSYSYGTCETTSKGLCKGWVQRCSNDRWSLPAGEPPAGWPCLIK